MYIDEEFAYKKSSYCSPKSTTRISGGATVMKRHEVPFCTWTLVFVNPEILVRYSICNLVCMLPSEVPPS